MSVQRWIGLYCMVIVPTLAATAQAVGFENHRIIARGAIDRVPERLASLFAENRLAFLERAIEPEAVWSLDPAKQRRRAWHGVGLDLEATERSRTARMAAAARFPRTINGARRLYRQHHVRVGGSLPWEVERLYRELVHAFREGFEADIIRASGHLVHFAGACASPFSATVDAEGRQAGNLVLGRREPGEPGYAHQTVQFRFDLELINRNGARYAERAATEPPVETALTSPLDGAFSVLLDSLSCLDEVLSADAEITTRLTVCDEAGFLGRADEFYILFDRRVGDLCVQRLRAGTELAAGLLRGAWEEAGAPTPSEIRGRRPEADSADASGHDASSSPRIADPGRFVASQSSKIFHRADCRHASRISPGNRVYFGTAAAARQQGRRPCRTCDPGGLERRAQKNEMEDSRGASGLPSH